MINEFIPPMLCKKSVGTLNSFNGLKYLYQKKYDGSRALFFITKDGLRIQNRRFADVGSRFPEFFINPTIFLKDCSEVVLDGELVYLEAGKPNIYITQFRDKDHSDSVKRNLLAEKYPLTFIAFDILYKDGVDLRNEPIEKRLEILKESVWNMQDRIKIAETYDSNADIQKIFEGEEEGLIAKLRGSVYETSRSEFWIKIKKWEKSILEIKDMEKGKQNITLITELGRVSVSAEAQIKYFFEKLPKFVEVRHFPTRSKNGLMRFPVFERFLDE